MKSIFSEYEAVSLEKFGKHWAQLNRFNRLKVQQILYDAGRLRGIHQRPDKLRPRYENNH